MARKTLLPYRVNTAAREKVQGRRKLAARKNRQKHIFLSKAALGNRFEAEILYFLKGFDGEIFSSLQKHGWNTSVWDPPTSKDLPHRHSK